MSAVCASQCVRGKISNAAARPMTVLKNSLSVVWHVNSKIFLIKSVPLLGKLINGKLSSKKLLFKLVSYHYVERIGYLVRLSSDKRGNNAVYRLIYVLCSIAPHLLGKAFAQPGEYIIYELAASSQNIFIEAALAFVYSHGNASVKKSVGVFIVGIKVIKRVSALVYNAEHGGREIAFIEICGYTYVMVRAKACSKWMLGSSKTAMVHIYTHYSHKLKREFLLTCLVKFSEETFIGKLFLFGYLFYQRHDTLTKSREKSVALLHCKPVLVKSKAVVVGLFIRCAIFCKAKLCLKYLLKKRLEKLEIVCLLCCVPLIVCLNQKSLVCHVFLNGYLLHIPYILKGKKDNSRFLFVKLVLVGIEEFKCLHKLGTCGKLIALLAQNRKSMPSVFCSSLGSSCVSVEINKRHSMLVCALL